jgi:hypothetical protein
LNYSGTRVEGKDKVVQKEEEEEDNWFTSKMNMPGTKKRRTIRK